MKWQGTFTFFISLHKSSFILPCWTGRGFEGILWCGSECGGRKPGEKTSGLLYREREAREKGLQAALCVSSQASLGPRGHHSLSPSRLRGWRDGFPRCGNSVLEEQEWKPTRIQRCSYSSLEPRSGGFAETLGCGPCFPCSGGGCICSFFLASSLKSSLLRFFFIFP